MHQPSAHDHPERRNAHGPRSPRLAVGLVGGMILPLIGVPLTPTPTVTVTPSGLLEIVIAVILGGLLYRDIMRRERDGADPRGR